MFCEVRTHIVGKASALRQYLDLPQLGLCRRDRLRAGGERRDDVLLVREQTARDDRLADLRLQPLEHARHGAREQIDRVRVRALAQHVFERERVEQEKALDGQQAERLCPADDVRAGRNDAVRLCVLRDEIRGDVPRGQTLDQVGMNKNDLARLLDPLDVRGDVQDRTVQKKYGRAVAPDRLFQTGIALERGDHRTVLQRVHHFFSLVLPQK